MRKLVNISNRLPVTIGKKIAKSSGGLISALEGLEGKLDLKWVGWPGGVISSDSRQEELSEKLAKEYQYYPIFLSRTQVNDYYNGFSNTSLWPLLHYMANYSRHEERWYEAYRQVNRQFAEAVLELIGSDDMVWVHDYHLMLLPAMLREARPGLSIGYFLHTPFPSYELFRCHPKREELLSGILGADLIGFHTFGYLRHFRSAVLRVLGMESEMNKILVDKHQAKIGVYPIGIDAGKFLRELESEAFRKYRAKFDKVYQDKKVVLSVERLDYTKGIPRRLDAADHFLSGYRDKDNIVFIFICVPSRGEVQEYQDLVERVEKRISEINGRYSTLGNVPIHFMHKSIQFSQLCALYSRADVAMVTPLIDGMNLVAKEYVACQQDKNGVLILSEFAGAAQELFNSMVVNPYDIKQMSESIGQALELPEQEKADLMLPMRERVLTYDAAYWADSFLGDLAETVKHVEQKGWTEPLDEKVVLRILRSEKLGLFLDYDGTLCEIKTKPSDAYPHAEIKELYEVLMARPEIDVYLISGRKRADMDAWFSDYPFTLIAEHGYFYKMRGFSEWVILDPRADLSWMDQIIEIFRHFSGSTPGSSIEQKTSSVVWHYRRSDPEFGEWKAYQLMGELMEMLSNLPVEIHHGKKIVEVSSTHINKGMALEHFLQAQGYKAVVCAGDDETDESMFRLDHEQIVSIKVGDGETVARYKVPSPKELRDFLIRALG
ncbi:MAG: bifunctional alpha,alpha-trehalose-phosphate synthase (UDP-forming)/trehalose-phosphatase [Sedimentisphaerales bacterium]|nr:bifunctional alpha,alpha-trehalose-phosphate synthase (UDP-forming)/trehalose-phosphatase [Sedimentisphaerales bacterium]